jgi:hypothetical protein
LGIKNYCSNCNWIVISVRNPSSLGPHQPGKWKC